jgi:hypothetical protein
MIGGTPGCNIQRVTPGCRAVWVKSRIEGETIWKILSKARYGIDVHAFEGQPVRCFAILNSPGEDPFQIVAYEPRLQSALELASAKNCEAEVSFKDDGTFKVAIRVRLLDG